MDGGGEGTRRDPKPRDGGGIDGDVHVESVNGC